MKGVHDRVLTLAFLDVIDPDQEEVLSKTTTDLCSHAQKKMGNEISIRSITSSDKPLRGRRRTCRSKAYRIDLKNVRFGSQEFQKKTPIWSAENHHHQFRLPARKERKRKERRRHPNTIAYPENFLESAQAIAMHSHLRWPDLSREWIRRKQTRIARVDWESRLPLIIGPRKSRLNLFTRKQQKLLKKAREMSGTPDLSALIKGRLQLLKKSAVEGSSARSDRADASQEDRPDPIYRTVDVDPPASKSKKRAQKKTEEKKVPSAGGAASGEGVVPVEGSLEGLAAKKKKKTKRSREDLEGSVDRDDPALDSAAEGLENEASEERRKRKRPRRRRPRRRDNLPVLDLIPRAPMNHHAMMKRLKFNARREGFPPRMSKPRIDFADRVEFFYNEKTPLVCNPGQCAELSRQIRGGPREMTLVGDLFFKEDYIDAALASRRADGCMNVLVEKYNTALKQTMTELGSTAKLARARLGVIERLRAEQKKISEKTLEEKEVLRVKFEELEAALRADRAAKKELARENAILESAKADLEMEKVELQAERDAVTQKLIQERKRLRDSRSQEVTRERVRVQSAMTDKLGRCLGRVRSYLAQRDLSEREKNLLGQASGTRKCLEMIKEEKLEITQDLIDVFIQQEVEHSAEVAKLGIGPLPEDELTLSPLVVRSRFVNEEFMATLDPHGSNDNLVRSETASQLRTPCDVLGEESANQSGENPVIAALFCEERDPHAGDETGGKDDTSAWEDRPQDVDSAKFVEVPDSSSKEEDENVEAD
ncbi:hypothetical protein Bca4012_026424 [Brassica carinata]|uniref:Uncharacterized protein n=1 Tax=Brassica carinata TaxID=52824 RepID=A0A8X7VJ49_BRACI|nr:hypothetical protein Bca52824_023467 [Brassica carinata]